MRKGQRTENGGWGGEWRKAMHTQNEKKKGGKRQGKGGEKARGKTEAMRKQGKWKVEAR